jgi:hypothetical protein
MGYYIAILSKSWQKILLFPVENILIFSSFRNKANLSVFMFFDLGNF